MLFEPCVPPLSCLQILVTGRTSDSLRLGPLPLVRLGKRRLYSIGCGDPFERNLKRLSDYLVSDAAVQPPTVKQFPPASYEDTKK